MPGKVLRFSLGHIMTTTFIANPAAAASYHQDGIVILHTGKGSLFSSNGTGARIWRGVEQQLSLDAIAQQLSVDYRISLATARQDTLNFLAQLQQHELVQPGVLS